jgi:hypothetical protein
VVGAYDTNGGVGVHDPAPTSPRASQTNARAPSLADCSDPKSIF